ncbi:MAG: peptidylprolyl isomerase, partial [Acidobacteriota bacterium]|nr:peptidylprolyl isomerase [Acidobacteriota bacterium]
APPPGPSPASSAARVGIDRIVAVVNTDLVLESDVDAEQRFLAFQPLRAETTESRDKLLERLIDRDLILQQMKQQPQPPIPDAEVDAQLATMRKSLPECAAYKCDTDAGWTRLAADHGFTPQEVRDRWRTRMEVLRFIEERFRMGIRITQAEIDDYYKNKLVPAYEKSHTAPPPQASINDRIQEILLQQQVNGLLEDWLKALRAQGSVRILAPERGTP